MNVNPLYYTRSPSSLSSWASPFHYILHFAEIIWWPSDLRSDIVLVHSYHFKALHALLFLYLSEHSHPLSSPQKVCYDLLVLCRMRLAIVGVRLVCGMAFDLWNSFPHDHHDCSSVLLQSFPLSLFLSPICIACKAVLIVRSPYCFLNYVLKCGASWICCSVRYGRNKTLQGVL